MAITPPWALRVGAPDCFHRPTAIGVATTVIADDTSLAFTAVDGEGVTSNEYFTRATFTGTDITSGGCTAGDRGTLTSDTPCDPAQSSPR
jgi:hypothetical protein